MMDFQQILNVFEDYSLALSMLDDYDHQRMSRPQGRKGAYVLTYEECRSLIDTMRFYSESDLFGHERMIRSGAALETFTRLLQGRTFIPQ